MAKNLDNINKIRAANNLPPLDKLPEEGDGNPTHSDPPAAPDNDPPTPAGQHSPAAPAVDPTVPVEIDDNAILEGLKKRGITVGSLADLIPQPDPVKAAEKREVDKLSYSLNKGLFTIREHENFIREKNNPRDLVFAAYYQEAKTEDPSLSNEDIQAEFEDKYAINSDPNSRKFKRGVEEISLLSDKILRTRYKNIYAADANYLQHETTENEKLTRARTVLAKAPAYRQEVENVFNGLKKIAVPVSDTESYDIEVPEASINAIKALFLDPDNAAKEILKGYTADSLRDVAYTALLRENVGHFAAEVGKRYHLARQAGVKGIPPAGPQSRTAKRVLSDDQKKVLADHGISEDDLPAPAAN